ncbi:ABC transporter ATP-binding protein [Corynebacterium sphenisci]|uniref:ABC transporter ATP-binding protein n=1 Tax=Corynebacterium sphenisci TaxID=191493 RepID=UPI0026E04CA3|nr:ABC transporter ATP-binding protein [Corynebacterium sphenisci]MDO5731307.1 ABC transporter ATP-binding protein [Corynebacterium sphenisci]
MSLTIEDLHFAYGSNRVLRGMSISTLRGGSVVGLLGPNAAGKSTLVKTIAGIHRADGGRAVVRLGEREPRGAELRRTVGYVPQDLPTSASLTAFETILVAGRRSGTWRMTDEVLEAAGAVLELMGIAHLASRYVAELSGGQRQLVAVAQMLVREPRVMLLDEPTSALDLRHQVELLKIVRHQVARTDSLGVVAIHDLNLAARYCDELVVLADGVAHAQGTPAEVLVPDVLERVYGLRARVLDDGGVPVVCPVHED